MALGMSRRGGLPGSEAPEGAEVNRAGRITYIARKSTKPEPDWRRTESAEHRIVFTDSIPTVDFLLRRGMREMNLDVERFILDRVASNADFLRILSAIPEELQCDVIQIAEDGSGFLSAAGRRGGRVLYALSSGDVRFYLEAHDLVTGRLLLERRAVA
jgi:hypothetical protein